MSVTTSSLPKQSQTEWVTNTNLVFALRVFSFLSSLLTISVLGRTSQLKHGIYRFMLVNVIIDAMYSGLLVLSKIVFVILCNNNAPTECGIWANIFFITFYIYISEYLTSCLAFFNILLEICLTVQRIVIIKNNTYFRNDRLKLACFLMFVLTFILHSPVLFMYKFGPLNTEGKRSLIKTAFGKDSSGKIILTSLSILRIALATVVLLIVNIFAVVKFRQFQKKKLKLSM